MQRVVSRLPFTSMCALKAKHLALFCVQPMVVSSWLERWSKALSTWMELAENVPAWLSST